MASENVLYLLGATCIFLIGAAVGHSGSDTASDVIGKVEIHIVHIFLKTS